MIEVSCPSSRMNNHQYLYSRWNKMELIKLSIKEDGMNYEKELTVAEAEQLSNDLLEWVRDIKGYEEEEIS